MCQRAKVFTQLLPARLYDRAGISYEPVCVSVRLSVCHTPVLYRMAAHIELIFGMQVFRLRVLL